MKLIGKRFCAVELAGRRAVSNPPSTPQVKTRSPLAPPVLSSSFLCLLWNRSGLIGYEPNAEGADSVWIDRSPR